MKTIITCLLTLLITAIAGLAVATDLHAQQNRASATVKVVVTVKPHITVSAQSAVVNAGTVGTGDFAVTMGFRVDSGSPAVEMSIMATDLYKADGSGAAASSIPVSLARGVVVTPSAARPTDGSNVARFVTTGTVDGAPAHGTESLRFETGQKGGRFAQDVQVTVTWSQDDDAKPPGEYGGSVRLMAMVLP